MTVIAVIGGTGSAQLNADVVKELPLAETPFGQPSGPVSECVFGQKDTSFLFLPRHGPVGGIPPHRVNYRANIWALHEQQPDYIVALNAVGGISDDAMPARLVIPEQLIDYTSGRAHTYFDGDLAPLEHIDFTAPFAAGVRDHLIATAKAQSLDFIDGGTYAVTQGPRLETAAEIDRLEQDGCNIVGMTAMPEAALARELGMDYVICAVVVNRAAGRAVSGNDIHAEIEQSISAGMSQAEQLLKNL